jgi:ABC-2 type transport system permease protein
MTQTLRQIQAFLRRDYILASASPLSYAWQVAGVVLVAPLLHYIGRLIPGSRHLEPFGGSYFAFVVLGLAVFGFLSAGTSTVGAAVRQEQTVGTLEAVLATPSSLISLVLGAALWPLIVAGVSMLLYLIIARWAFGADLTRANIISGATILAVAVPIALAASILGAAVVLVFRIPDPITGVFTGVSAVLAGVFYPTTVLPPALQRLAEFLPWTHALRAVRLAVLQGYGLGALQKELVVLLGFAAVLVPVSIAVFRRALHYAKTSGTIHTY